VAQKRGKFKKTMRQERGCWKGGCKKKERKKKGRQNEEEKVNRAAFSEKSKDRNGGGEKSPKEGRFKKWALKKKAFGGTVKGGGWVIGRFQTKTGGTWKRKKGG